MNNKKSGDDLGSEIFSWIAVVIAFAVFWPVGFFLLFKKLGGYIDKHGSKASGGGTQQGRAYEYPPEVNADALGRARSDMADRAAKKGKAAAKEQKEKDSGGFIQLALLILGIVLLLVGASNLSAALTAAGEMGLAGSALWSLIKAAFYFAGGGASFLFRGRFQRRSRRQKRYMAIIGQRRAVQLSELVEKSGASAKTVRSDLEDMLDSGAFGSNAYIDIGLDSIVMSPEDAEEERDRRYAADKAAETAAAPQNRYMSVLEELRNLNTAITDELISEKITRIEELTAKIFRAVEEKPEKLSEIRKFMDYYLPTTLKLLRSYATLERQGIEGENIASAKNDIGRILDTLADGYEQQLDQLFKSDMMDISSDIDVLETMMEKDGLSGDNPFLQTGGGH